MIRKIGLVFFCCAVVACAAKPITIAPPSSLGDAEPIKAFGGTNVQSEFVERVRDLGRTIDRAHSCCSATAEKMCDQQRLLWKAAWSRAARTGLVVRSA